MLRGSECLRRGLVLATPPQMPHRRTGAVFFVRARGSSGNRSALFPRIREKNPDVGGSRRDRPDWAPMGTIADATAQTVDELQRQDRLGPEYNGLVGLAMGYAERLDALLDGDAQSYVVASLGRELRAVLVTLIGAPAEAAPPSSPLDAIEAALAATYT